MFLRSTYALLALAAALLPALNAPKASGADESEHPKAPIQIEALSNRKEGNLVIAEGNVVIGVADTVLYCNYAQYDITTRDVLVSGDVRIFKGDKVFSGDRAIYNLDTKHISGAEFRTSAGPFLAQAHAISSTGSDTFEVSRGLFTTDNSSDPGFHLRARKVRIFRNDHTEYENVTVYAGRTPVLWLPYLYQPAKSDQSFSIAPGARSEWGPFLLTRFAFPVGAHALGGARLDYLAKRGVGLGVDVQQDNKAAESWSRFRSYYIRDKTPGSKELGSSNDEIKPNRYRVSLQDRSFLSETVYTTVNFNRVSDINYYKDFSPAELQRDPNPDSVFALTKRAEQNVLTLEIRKQFNRDYEGTESLPALSLDMQRQQVAGSGLFYEGETSAGKFRRNFVKNAGAFDYLYYDTVRLDTFHQLTYPKLLLGWLSLVPRLGLRATHYSSSVTDNTIAAGYQPGDPLYNGNGGALNRYVFNAGLEASFKLSREFPTVENRSLGLDGLRHIFQPFADWSWVNASRNPTQILPIDVLSGSSKLQAIDFPQFNTIDSIADWDIVRFGVRNRLQTRRDDETINWLELESFLDNRIKRPEFNNAAAGSADGGHYSNVFNRLHWVPLPWMNVEIESQLPLIDQGYTEFNSTTSFQVSRNVSFSVGNRYVAGNPYFNNSNLINGGARMRLNDNWSFSFEENYEAVSRQLEYQRYSIDRDLRSWVASLSLVVRERDSKNDVAVLLTLSLKDIPKFRLPIHFDPESSGGSGTSKNR